MTLLSTRFESFSPEHFGLIGLFLAVFVGLVVYGRRRGDNPRFRRGFAIVIPCFTLPMQIQQLTPGEFGLGTSLPLQYCDLAWMLAVYALWTRAPWAFVLTFFWGLTLTLQGVITPSLGQEFPEPRYFMFWGMHFLTIWAAGYLTAIGDRPTWRLYRFTVVVTAAWAGVVMIFNALTDTNYGYLNRKPPGASLLDALPGWPAYVVIEIAIIAAVWAAMTWAFQTRPQRAKRTSTER
ncbi:TIGR02206 family membrane protein [Nocardioides marmoriginsengisoli]|uniref:TIGR02206 family membrane protein n=1 Tax=Nocardioides marmoriginsengisoli TaxID=661483 RepID=A0A3N0CMJ1_9ACTN|nr:TIGR02206 family membrane protein [Nocardioides marmoriginsengisoli]RNL64276.1 TIGR02206 family membrane protein [Nocardioides marmoriginsengisoli]